MLEFLGRPELEPGNRIEYRFTAKRNGKEVVVKKRGVFVRKVKHSKRLSMFSHKKQKAAVYFDGNKEESRVNYSQLTKESEE